MEDCPLTKLKDFGDFSSSSSILNELLKNSGNLDLKRRILFSFMRRNRP